MYICKDYCEFGFISGGNYFIVVYGFVWLDDVSFICCGGFKQIVGKWEEGVRGYGRVFCEVFVQIQFCGYVFGFCCGNICVVYVVYLVCVDVDGCVVFDIDDGVGFYVFCDFLCKLQICYLCICWCFFGDDFQFVCGNRIYVFVLD